MKKMFLFLVLSLIGLSAFAQPRYIVSINKVFNYNGKANTPIQVLCFVYDLSSGEAELVQEEDLIVKPYTSGERMEVVGYGEYYLQIYYYHCTEDGIQLSDLVLIPDLMYLNKEEHTFVLIDMYIGIVNPRAGLPTMYPLKHCVIIPENEYEKYGID